MQWWLSIASIRLAVVCLVVWFVIRVWTQNSTTENSTSKRLNSRADLIWIIGSIASLIHMLAVFAYVHHWSHKSAVEHTAQQTDEFMGFAVGVGVYFNYLFVGLWLFDAAWLAISKDSYDKRHVWISRIVYGYMLFIAFNGAVVFVPGWFRWFAAALFLVLGASWVWKLGRHEPAGSKRNNANRR